VGYHAAAETLIHAQMNRAMKAKTKEAEHLINSLST